MNIPRSFNRAIGKLGSGEVSGKDLTDLLNKVRDCCRDVEKSGIRFPSRLYVEEAYISRSGRKYVRSETETVYTNYKFFVVETEAVFDR